MSDKAIFRRLQRPWLLFACLLFVALMVAVAYWLGSLAGSAEQRALEQEVAPIPVTAVVEERAIGTVQLGQGVLAAGNSMDIGSPVASEPSIVTASVGSAGAVVHEPLLLGAVNDRPVFVLPLRIPLYRDLQVGDTGPDVESLRATLGLPAGNVVNGQMVQAVNKLYADQKICAPSKCGTAAVARLEFVDVPDGASVRSVAAVGSAVSAEHPMAVLQTSPDSVTATVPSNVIEHVSVDSAVSLEFRGNKVPGAVSAIGDFTPAKDGEPAGYRISLRLTDSAAPLPAVGENVLISTDAARTESMVVPLLSLRSGPSGDYVIVDDGGDRRRAVVHVDVSEDGFAGISSSDLTVGEEVLVSAE